MSVGRGRGGTGRFLHKNKKKGATWGKHGFPHGSELKASDAQGLEFVRCSRAISSGTCS
jgi:hypothetical protein